VFIAFVKILAASIVMGAAARLAASGLATLLPSAHLIGRAVQLAGAIAVGVIVLIAAARVLRLAEFDDAFARVVKRLRPSA
jgi:hypothetical protein